LLSPKKRTPSGLKVRAPADRGMTWLAVFIVDSSPLSAADRFAVARG
jgi:hypothetical protein